MSKPNLNSRKTPEITTRSFLAVGEATKVEILPAPIFTKVLYLERKRAERSGRRLVLMLVESPVLLRNGAADKIQLALSRSTRETDIKGWHRDGSVLGVIFTEFPLAGASAVETLFAKVNSALTDLLSAQEAGEVTLSFHVFPEHDEEQEDSSLELISANASGPSHRPH